MYWDRRHFAFVKFLLSPGLDKQAQTCQTEKASRPPTGPRALSSNLGPTQRNSSVGGICIQSQDTGNNARGQPQAEGLGVSMEIAGEIFAMPLFRGMRLSEMSYVRFVHRFSESNPYWMRKKVTNEDLLYAYKDWIFAHFRKTATLADVVKACMRVSSR